MDDSSKGCEVYKLKYNEDAITELIGRITDDEFYCFVLFPKLRILLNKKALIKLTEKSNSLTPAEKAAFERQMFTDIIEFRLKGENGKCSLFDPDVPEIFRLDKEKCYEFLIGDGKIEIRDMDL